MLYFTPYSLTNTRRCNLNIDLAFGSTQPLGQITNFTLVHYSLSLENPLFSENYYILKWAVAKTNPENRLLNYHVEISNDIK